MRQRIRQRASADNAASLRRRMNDEVTFKFAAEGAKKNVPCLRRDGVQPEVVKGANPVFQVG